MATNPSNEGFGEWRQNKIAGQPLDFLITCIKWNEANQNSHGPQFQTFESHVSYANDTSKVPLCGILFTLVPKAQSVICYYTHNNRCHFWVIDETALETLQTRTDFEPLFPLSMKPMHEMKFVHVSAFIIDDMMRYVKMMSKKTRSACVEAVKAADETATQVEDAEKKRRNEELLKEVTNEINKLDSANESDSANQSDPIEIKKRIIRLVDALAQTNLVDKFQDEIRDFGTSDYAFVGRLVTAIINAFREILVEGTFREAEHLDLFEHDLVEHGSQEGIATWIRANHEELQRKVRARKALMEALNESYDVLGAEEMSAFINDQKQKRERSEQDNDRASGSQRRRIDAIVLRPSESDDEAQLS